MKRAFGFVVMLVLVAVHQPIKQLLTQLNCLLRLRSQYESSLQLLTENGQAIKMLITKLLSAWLVLVCLLHSLLFLKAIKKWN